MPSEDHLHVFWTGFSHLLGLQLASRSLTFLLNAFVTRRISPSDYGLAAFRFPLLNTSVLMHSKEEELRSVLPFALLPIPIGGIVLLCFVLYFNRTAEESSIPSIVFYKHIAAIGIELLSEPLYIVASLWVKFKLRARVEGTAFFVKSLLTSLLLTYTSRDPATAFADAQVAYAAVSLAGYLILLPAVFSIIYPNGCILHVVEQLRTPHGVKNEALLVIDRGRLRLTGVFMIQTLEKWVLAEGSKVVLMGSRNLSVEGVYGLIDNLGSIVVRTVFKPFEEAAFTAFSRTGTSRESSEMTRTAKALTALIRCVLLVGFLAMVFGPPSSSILLRVLYSTNWSDTEAPFVLACYCPYIALMALNGICEAFVHAVLDVRGLGESNLFMLISASVHVAASIVLVKKFGAVGLVASHGINMLIRIAFAMWCIKRHFGRSVPFGVMDVFPCQSTIYLGVIVGLLLYGCKHALAGMGGFVVLFGGYVGVVSLCILLMIYVLWRNERGAWDALNAIKQTKSHTKTD